MIAPTVRATRAAFPDAEIVLLCNQAAIPIFEKNQDVSVLLPVVAEKFCSCLGYFREISELRGDHFDLMFILEQQTRSADRARLWARRAHVSFVISTACGHFKKLSHLELPENPLENWPKHYLESLGPFTIGAAP